MIFFFMAIPMISNVPQVIKFMKSWKFFNLIKFYKLLNRSLWAKKGQSIVEFVLLLAAIAGLSYFFVSMMNKNIAKYWEYSVNLIVNDNPNDTKKLNLR